MKNVKESIVLLRDVKGSILVSDAESCMFTSHCEQIRIPCRIAAVIVFVCM